MKSTNKYLSNFTASGFVLIEALLAFVLVAIGLMALAGLTAVFMYSNADSRMRTHALHLAQEKIEELRAYKTAEDYGTLTCGTDTATGENATFTRTCTLDAVNTTGGSNFRHVTVEVAWTDSKGKAQKVALQSEIGRKEPMMGSAIVTAYATSSGGTSSTSSSTSSTSSSTSSTSSSTSSTSSSTSSSGDTSSSTSSTSSSTSSSSGDPVTQPVNTGGGLSYASGRNESDITRISLVSASGVETTCTETSTSYSCLVPVGNYVLHVTYPDEGTTASLNAVCIGSTKYTVSPATKAVTVAGNGTVLPAVKAIKGNGTCP